MKKIVPDPPHETLAPTANTLFGLCGAGHDPMFLVRPGIEPHDALVHVSLFLRGAYDTAHQASETADESAKGFLWSTMHSVEMAKGLVDALLDGIEARALSERSG